jgi:GT2 family glycosyltransferase
MSKTLEQHSNVERRGAGLGVGAVVLHYRHWPGVAGTLKSLLAQTSPPDLVIVVDNHSGDGSASRLRASFPEVEVLEAERNGGYAAGMNLGIEELRRRDVDAILLLTHECQMAPDALEALVARLQEAPTVAAVGPLLGFSSAPEQVFSAGGEVEPRWGTRHHRQPSMISDWAGAPPSSVECLDGAALLIRMAAVRQAGMMDERYFMYFEETEYLLKLQRLGWRIECVPRAIGWQEPTPKSPALWDRNRLRFLARNGSRAVLAREIARLVRDVARDLRSPTSEESRAVARARARGLGYFLTRRWGPVPE